MDRRTDRFNLTTPGNARAAVGGHPLLFTGRLPIPDAHSLYTALPAPASFASPSGGTFAARPPMRHPACSPRGPISLNTLQNGCLVPHHDTAAMCTPTLRQCVPQYCGNVYPYTAAMCSHTLRQCVPPSCGSMLVHVAADTNRAYSVFRIRGRWFWAAAPQSSSGTAGRRTGRSTVFDGRRFLLIAVDSYHLPSMESGELRVKSRLFIAKGSE